jgi:ABC-type transport system involved in multi-copper enzyme maturation permease subunit
MKQHFLIALRSGLRSHVLQSLLAIGVLMMGAAYLAGTFSPRQPATVTLDVGFSFVRAVGLIMVLFWAYEFVGREIDRRTIFVSLTYPAPRSHFLLGRYLGMLVLTVMVVALLGALLAGTTLLSELTYDQSNPVSLKGPYLLALLALVLDLAVVASFGFLIAVVSTTPFLPLLVGLAFAVSARSLGPAMEYLALMGGKDTGLKDTLLPVFDVLRWTLPDLSRLDIRYYPIYAHQPDTSLLLGMLLMAIGYIGMMLALAIWVFRRRQFN